MKKSLLLLFLVSSSYFQAQTLLTENCTALTVGNFGSDLTGATVGQGGWATFIAASGTNESFQVVDNGAPQGNVIKITGSAAAANSRFLTKDVSAEWLARTTGNDIAQLEYKFFTGPATTSKNTMRCVMYNEDGTIMIGGILVFMDTKEVRGLSYYDNAGAIGNYSFGLGATAATPIILAENTWYTFGVSYNYLTGEVLFREGNGLFDGGVDGAAAGTDIFETYVLGGAGATNAVASIGLFDDITLKADATDTLLSVNSNATVSNKLSVYPNPANQVVNISNTNGLNVSDITFSDINGRNVKTTSVSTLGDIVVNVSDLAQGVYVMKINTNEGSITKKLIKE